MNHAPTHFVSYHNPAEDVLHAQISSADAVLTRCMSGDHLLYYVLAGAQRVVAYEPDHLQLHVTRLKLAAMRVLDCNEFFAVFGENNWELFRDRFADIADYLPTDTAEYWADHARYAIGWIRASRAGMYVNALCTCLRISDHTLSDYFDADEPLTETRTRMQHVFQLASHLLPLVADVAPIETNADALRRNPFVRALFIGRYSRESCPAYMRPEHYDIARQRLSRIRLHAGDAQDACHCYASPFTVFAPLLDFDSVSAEEAERVFCAVSRQMQRGRVCALTLHAHGAGNTHNTFRRYRRTPTPTSTCVMGEYADPAPIRGVLGEYTTSTTIPHVPSATTLERMQVSDIQYTIPYTSQLHVTVQHTPEPDSDREPHTDTQTSDEESALRAYGASYTQMYKTHAVQLDSREDVNADNVCIGINAGRADPVCATEERAFSAEKYRHASPWVSHVVGHFSAPHVRCDATAQTNLTTQARISHYLKQTIGRLNTPLARLQDLAGDAPDAFQMEHRIRFTRDMSVLQEIPKGGRVLVVTSGGGELFAHAPVETLAAFDTVHVHCTRPELGDAVRRVLEQVGVTHTVSTGTFNNTTNEQYDSIVLDYVLSNDIEWKHCIDTCLAALQPSGVLCVQDFVSVASDTRAMTPTEWLQTYVSSEDTQSRDFFSTLQRTIERASSYVLGNDTTDETYSEPVIYLASIGHRPRTIRVQRDDSFHLLKQVSDMSQYMYITQKEMVHTDTTVPHVASRVQEIHDTEDTHVSSDSDMTEYKETHHTL